MRWGFESGKTIGHALVLVFLRAALLFVVGLGIVGTAVLGEDFAAHGWRSVAFVVVLLGAFDFGFILNLGLLRFAKTSLRELGWTFENVGRDVALGLLGFAVSAGVLLTAYVASGESTVGEVLAHAAGYSLTERLIYLTIAIFGAALVEETLFRGYLQPALAQKVGLPAAILLQGFIFAVMHMNFHAGSLIVKTCFGVIFGVLRWRKRSLLVPGIAHGLIWAVFGA